MKLFLQVLGSLIAGALGTLAIVIATLLTLLATTPEIGTRNEGFFGALFFEAAPQTSDSFMMNFGVADPLPLLISSLAIALVTFLALYIHPHLRAYRHRLLRA